MNPFFEFTELININKTQIYTYTVSTKIDTFEPCDELRPVQDVPHLSPNASCYQLMDGWMETRERSPKTSPLYCIVLCSKPGSLSVGLLHVCAHVCIFIMIGGGGGDYFSAECTFHLDGCHECC